MSSDIVGTPSDYVEEPTYRTAYRHVANRPKGRIAANVGAASVISAVGAGTLVSIIEGISYAVGAGTFWAVPFLGASFAVGSVLAYGKMTEVDAAAADERALREFKREGGCVLSNVTKHIQHRDDPDRYRWSESKRSSLDKDAEKLAKDCQSIMDMENPAMMHIRRRMLLRMAGVNAALRKSLSDLGSSSSSEVLEIATNAVRNIVREAIDARAAMIGHDDDIGRSIADRMRLEVAEAVAIGTPRKEDDIASGTGHARIDRLIAKGREALAIDPDMVDSAGARVDAAFRDHLPRLLRAHAESARHARVEDLEETDRQLETGIEQIRAMLEDGLQSLRHEKADALRTEVAFLKMRRSGAEGPLRAITAGNQQ